MDHSSTFDLQLFGALKMRSPSGKDVTPRLAKTQGLLAFLALAEEQPVNRSTLQNLLWSDRMPKQGRDSLKKALSELRKCFAEAGEDPLITNGGPVRLMLSDISVDALTGYQPQRTALYDPQFLDGLDIRDECFNRWLIDIRTKLDNRPSALEQPRLAAPGEHIGMPSDAPFMIGILPPRHMGTDEKAGHVANVLINGLQRALEQSGVFSVYDFRPSADLGAVVDRDADMFLNVDASSFGEDVFVGMKLTKVGDAKLIWNLEETIHLPDLSPRTLHVRASTQVDQICEAVKNAAGFFDSGHIAARSVMSAIDHIFRLSNSNLESAENALSSAVGLVETSTYYAWYAFLAAFQVEKLGRNNAEDIIERAESFSAKALELDRNNPLTLALVSHVHSFVLRDTDRARELVGPVRHMAGQNVMLADTIAMLHFYLGEYDKAKQHAELACDLGRNNLFRYSFTTSLAMSELMLGEHRQAIKSARRALAQHPVGNGHQYEPTLRTLASALSWAGDVEDGRSVLRRLDRQFGTKTLEKLKSADDAPFPNTEVFGVVRKGLESLHAD